MAADPGWDFKDKLPGPGRGAAKHYRTEPERLLFEAYWRILQPGLGRVADDAVMFMWRVASMQLQALMLMQRWCFEPKSEMVWLKRTLNGKRHFGMGRQVRMEHEICLIGTRGRNVCLDKGVRSTFMECGPCMGTGYKGFYSCPVCGGTGAASDTEILEATKECSPSIVFTDEASRRHSEKPQAFFNIVERMYGGPRLELFARDRRLGWDALGDEL